MLRYPRDLAGCGETPPTPGSPDGAKIAVQVVLNHEAGGENKALLGDAAVQRRFDTDRAAELAEACRKVERIAELRLQEKLGQ